MTHNKSVCFFYRKHIIERKALLSINRCNLRSWQQLVCMSMLPWCSALVSASPLAVCLPASQPAWCNIQIIRDQADKWSLISGDKVRHWMDTGQKTSIRVSHLLTSASVHASWIGWPPFNSKVICFICNVKATHQGTAVAIVQSRDHKKIRPACFSIFSAVSEACLIEWFPIQCQGESQSLNTIFGKWGWRGHKY